MHILNANLNLVKNLLKDSTNDFLNEFIDCHRNEGVDKKLNKSVSI